MAAAHRTSLDRVRRARDSHPDKHEGNAPLEEVRRVPLRRQTDRPHGHLPIDEWKFRSGGRRSENWRGTGDRSAVS